MDKGTYEVNVSTAELKRRLLGKVSKEETVDALRALLYRGEEMSTELMAQLLEDPGQYPEVKKTVASVLGRNASDANRELLLSQVRKTGDPVLERVLRSLGKIGDENTMVVLEKLEAPVGTPVRRALDFARSFISYRLRLDKYLYDPPAASRLVTIKKTIDFEVGKPDQKEVKKVLASVSVTEELPGIDLSPQGALHLSCRGADMLLVFVNKFHLVSNLRTLSKKNAFPLLMLQRTPSFEFYHPARYLFTQPIGKKGELALLGVKPSGEMVNAGEVKLSKDQAAFSLKSLPTHRASAIDLEGHLDFEKKEIVLSKARVSLEVSGKEGIRRPQPAPPPFPR